jgi:hypothetical protein
MFTKLDLIERIIATNDEKVLEKVGKALETEKGEFAFTKEHLALLEERRERRRKGLGKGYTLSEVKRMVKTRRKETPRPRAAGGGMAGMAGCLLVLRP